ncbi:PQ-loop repeat-containing protein [Mycoplasma wenyonii]|uniref:PQ-loop repeat-containing protein n=1 Tax=Mycoplasma wenyonii TaxID=65123 RepID=UPI0015EBDF25|nr:PQ-loop repeat-containing protein [Mycoplasma wenyonii]
MLFFLDDWNWHGCLAAVFVVIGAGAITSAFWPGFYKTYKTKDTKGLPIKLFALFLLVGILMTAGSIAGICKSPEWKPGYFKGWWFVYLNFFVMSVNAYTVFLWFKNKRMERNNKDQKSIVLDTSIDTRVENA